MNNSFTVGRTSTISAKIPRTSAERDIFYQNLLIFSPTDIVNYLGCRHATFLDRRNLDHPIPVAVDDPFLILLREKGHQHERRYLETLRGTGRKVVEISNDGSLEERVNRTREAMAAQEEVIYQGVLLNGRWHGYADFLFRVPMNSHLGDFSYEPIDTKLSRSAKTKHLLQLCGYAFLLGAEQGILPPRIHLVLGDGSAVAFLYADFQHYFEVARQNLETFVDHLPDTSVGQPCGRCDQCRWRDHCEAEWERLDHLSLVANITRHQTSKLEASQVTTMTSLARLPPTVRIPKLQTETLQRLVSQAFLQVRKRADGVDRFEPLPTDPGKGFDRLPPPSQGDLFFDMEGDPLVDGGLEYLFGFVCAEAGEVLFRLFWSHDRADEKKAIRQAVDFIWLVWSSSRTRTSITTHGTKRAHSNVSRWCTGNGKTRSTICFEMEHLSISTASSGKPSWCPNRVTPSRTSKF